jgi:(p)ppGpp synthase/HD superfamily hydrolase
MQDIRAELEDLAFRCIHPLRASMLETAINKSSGGRKRIVTKIRKELKRRLKSNGIEDVGVKEEKKIFTVFIEK